MLRKIGPGFLAVAGLIFGQGLTVSGRPGLVNFFEGEAFLNGNPVPAGARNPLYLNASDTFWTKAGKAEILLLPGSFLRIGDNSQIQMLSPSLVNTRVGLLQGEAILEVVGLIKGSRIEIVDNGSLVTIEKNGLYKLTAGLVPTAAVIEGSLQVTLLDQTIKLGKGRQTALVGTLESEKFDLALDDDLYAWSSVRSQYEAAANYSAASTLAAAGQYNVTGWYFSDLLDCWAWLPTGAFYSPFGWGFYCPARVGGATVVKCSVLRGGHWHDGHEHWVGLGSTRPVAINPHHPPALRSISSSPLSNLQVRSSSFRRLESSVQRSSSSRQGTGGGQHGHYSASAGHSGGSGSHTVGAGGGHSSSGGGHFGGGGGGSGHSGGGGGGGAGGGHSGGGGSSGGGGGKH